MNVKFEKINTRLSKEASYILANLNAQTHPDLAFRAWVEDPNRDTSKATQELLDGGYMTFINDLPNPTRLGVHYFKPAQAGSNIEVQELIRQIKQNLPRNPKFGVIVEGLSDTALMGLIYAAFGEIGIRGNPEDPEKVEYWQNKVNALQAVLTGATPDTLFEHHKAQMESFGTSSTVKKTVKKAKQ